MPFAEPYRWQVALLASELRSCYGGNHTVARSAGHCAQALDRLSADLGAIPALRD